MNYEIRTYQPEDSVKILSTFNAVFSHGNEDYIPRTQEQWDWEFLDNPAGNQIAIALDSEGEVICQYCCLPYFVNIRGEKAIAGLGVDSFVDPRARQGLKKEGVFLRTARHYFKVFTKPEVTAFGYGFPNDQAYRVGVKMLKYHEIRKPQFSLFRNLWQKPDDREVGKGRGSQSKIEEVKGFDKRFDAFWDYLIPSYPMSTWRDAAYLNWRYFKCHWIPYQVFTASDFSGQLKGFCVVRPNWQNHPMLAVTELLTHPDDDGTLADLLRFITKFARDNGQQRIEFWFAESSKAFDLSKSMGFSSEASPFNLVGRFYRDDLDLKYAYDNWTYTLGDMDIL